MATSKPVIGSWGATCRCCGGAHGRLPAYARASAETDDLVQVTLLRALSQLEKFGATQQHLGRVTTCARTQLTSPRDHPEADSG